MRGRLADLTGPMCTALVSFVGLPFAFLVDGIFMATMSIPLIYIYPDFDLLRKTKRIS